MKKLLCAAVVALGLAGCATNPADLEAQIAAVQANTRLICSFLPTAATVAEIIARGSGADTAVALATAICAAATTVPQAEGPGKNVPRYRGVVIRGRSVR